MQRPQHNYTSLKEFFAFLATAVGYLEKDSASDLGDFTDEGKIRNAGYNNNTVYWQWYEELGYGRYQGSYYCAAAVSTMCVNAFGLAKAKQILCGDLFIYCPTGYERFKNKGRIYKTPQPGDVVFYWSSSLGRYSHTGWVIDVDSDGNGYTTWEANTSPSNGSVVRNGGATCNKHYDLGVRKEAFGRPDWVSLGISTNASSSSDTLTTNNIGTWDNEGIVCTTEALNVRSYPATGKVIGTLYKGDTISPTKRTTINGSPWYYVDGLGWVSAKYFTGWVQEKDLGNRWWYLLPGYEYYTDRVVTIGNSRYYFGSDGYLFIGTMTITTDENGAIISAN